METIQIVGEVVAFGSPQEDTSAVRLSIQRPDGSILVVSGLNEAEARIMTADLFDKITLHVGVKIEKKVFPELGHPRKSGNFRDVRTGDFLIPLEDFLRAVETNTINSSQGNAYFASAQRVSDISAFGEVPGWVTHVLWCVYHRNAKDTPEISSTSKN